MRILVLNPNTSTAMTAEIAAAAEVSQATFFRYFSTKADVVWVESNAELTRFAALLDASDPAVRPSDVVGPAYISSLSYGVGETEWVRQRAQLILSVPAVAAHAVSRATGQDIARCRMAVAVAGSPTRGIEFLKSAERQDARRQMVRAIDSLIAADEADVLSRAKSLIVAVKAPLAEVKSTQEKVLEQNADYLSRGALKQLEDRNKRELNARERSGIMEALASARTLMRDVLLTLQDEAADVVNEDVRDTIGRLAAATNVAGATRALEAVATAERNIARNVTPQLAIEVMLFDIRKALKCR